MLSTSAQTGPHNQPSISFGASNMREVNSALPTSLPKDRNAREKTDSTQALCLPEPRRAPNAASGFFRYHKCRARRDFSPLSTQYDYTGMRTFPYLQALYLILKASLVPALRIWKCMARSSMPLSSGASPGRIICSLDGGLVVTDSMKYSPARSASINGHSISTLSACTNATRLPSSERLLTKNWVDDASRTKWGFGGGFRVDVKSGGIKDSIVVVPLWVILGFVLGR